MNEEKRDNMLKRILYTNYNEDLNGVIDYLFKRTDITSTEGGKRVGMNEYIQNISTLFNRNIDELIEHFLFGEGQQIIINKKFEKVDPYYRILYPGWESSEYSILNGIWPFYKDKKNNYEVDMDRDKISFEDDNHIFLKERPDPDTIGSYNQDNQIYLNEQGKTFKNTEYGFLEDPITRKQPIWPLDIPVEPLHRSKRPILKENDGSFKLQTIDYKNFGKFIETGILLKLLGKINNNKKIAVGITIVYITLSIYIFSYINKKTKRKNNEDIDDYRKRTKHPIK